MHTQHKLIDTNQMNRTVIITIAIAIMIAITAMTINIAIAVTITTLSELPSICLLEVVAFPIHPQLDNSRRWVHRARSGIHLTRCILGKLFEICHGIPKPLVMVVRKFTEAIAEMISGSRYCNGTFAHVHILLLPGSGAWQCYRVGECSVSLQ